MTERDLPLKIGIVGAGFSGTSLALNLHRFSRKPIEIFLFEKRGCFGAGEAYSTPFSFHLLNVRAHDMSAFDDLPDHFVHWLESKPHVIPYLNEVIPVREQFVPRLLYGQYLQDMLSKIHSAPSQRCKLIQISGEVIDVVKDESHIKLVLSDQTGIAVDKVVFALGNAPPAPMSFSMSPEVDCIHQPWDYHAPSQIGRKEAVFILGTSLSMIDVVLTLYHQGHEGLIYAISRRGLLPLPHANQFETMSSLANDLPNQLLPLFKQVRKKITYHMEMGGDWRTMMSAMRKHIPTLWASASLQDKKRFIRHVLPYWNIHRHRVHHHLIDLLKQLSERKQFKVLAGRILSVEQGKAKIKLRYSNQIVETKVKWLINCMGPSLNLAYSRAPLIYSLLQRGITSLDPLNLGFITTSWGALKEKSGHVSNTFYTLGPPAKSTYWESGAVPEIRKQSYDLARHFLEIS